MEECESFPASADVASAGQISLAKRAGRHGCQAVGLHFEFTAHFCTLSSMPVKIAYKGNVKEFPDKVTGEEIIKSLAPQLLATAIACKVNNEVWDRARPLPNGQVEFDVVTIDSPEGVDTMRHSSAHIMAGALKRLFPGTKLAIGPTIQDGFYYDVECPNSISDSELEKIEGEMAKIIKEDYKFERFYMPRSEAIKFMKERGESYKVEILEELQDPEVSFYRDGDFTDLCTGPHIPSTSWVKSFKLMKSTGAYWRGDEKNKMLLRIYGTAFDTKERLDEHLKRIEEAKKRDHRRLGKELSIFSVHEEIGGGLVLYHPKGAIIKHLIERYWYDVHLKNGYKLVSTPHIASEKLYEISGHLENYQDLMYSRIDIDGNPYRLKPMNCPGHIMIYNSILHSYRDLPLRLAEMGAVYRFEKQGVLHGLLRVRGFTIDDAHIFVAKDQLEEELIRVFDLAIEFLKVFGFEDTVIVLSTRPEKAIGSNEDWDYATNRLRHVLDKKGCKYQIEEGGGAFYGPKISIYIRDCLGREWQCSTIQMDFNLPVRFKVEYMSKEGRKETPYIIHRALYGSLERFIGILIEHYAGELPLWLAPVQVSVLSVTEKDADYAGEIYNKLVGLRIRADLDTHNERVSNKIRMKIAEKVPFIVIVGQKEKEQGTIAVRDKKQDLGQFTLDKFTKLLGESSPLA